MGKEEKKAEIILIDTPWVSQFARQILLGICQYTPSRCLWVFMNISSYEDEHLRHPDAVGLISMRRPEDYTTVAREYGLAAVGVGVWAPGREFSGLPYVDVDPRAIGKMAAEYFVNRGFANFGMISSLDPFHNPYRGDAFIAALRRRKLTCDVFDQEKEYPPCGESVSALTGLSERLRNWLGGLAKPAALFVINDTGALWVCEVCHRSNIHVPEEVAVLGANDDNIFCRMSHPHLSSIRVPAEQIGLEAARLLDAVISNRKVRKRPILLPPIDVATRQSTDVMAIDDLYIARAVQFIREHACNGIGVETVMAEVSLPRRTLERRFQAALNRSPFAEIRRVQIAKIKTLLSQTDMTLEAIAPECGFDDISHMSKIFKKTTGVPPGAYREQFLTSRKA